MNLDYRYISEAHHTDFSFSELESALSLIEEIDKNLIKETDNKESWRIKFDDFQVSMIRSSLLNMMDWKMDHRRKDINSQYKVATFLALTAIALYSGAFIFDIHEHYIDPYPDKNYILDYVSVPIFNGIDWTVDLMKGEEIVVDTEQLTNN